MAKRSDFDRVGDDFYPTPIQPIRHLVTHLTLNPMLWGIRESRPLRFMEPFYGDGSLVSGLESLSNHVRCSYASDINPRGVVDTDNTNTRTSLRTNVNTHDVFDFNSGDWMKIGAKSDIIITNPPWANNRSNDFQLFRIIDTLSAFGDAIFLLSSAVAFNEKSSSGVRTDALGNMRPIMRYCKYIIPVGRPSWMNNGVSGKDDCAWFIFNKAHDNKNAGPSILPRLAVRKLMKV